jgi:hypothetical protein
VAAFGVCPLSTWRTIRSRPFGVSRAFYGCPFVLRGVTEASQLPASGPSGQRIESSQLATPIREVPSLSVLVTGVLTTAGEARRGLALPRRDPFSGYVVIFSNQLFGSVSQLPSTSPGQKLSHFAAASVFQIMAWYAIFRLLASSDPTEVAQWGTF